MSDIERSSPAKRERVALSAAKGRVRALPDRHGYFGEFGGKYVPETLMAALEEFESAYRAVRRDRAFRRELDDILANFVGRPTALSEAPKFAELCGGGFR